MLKCFASDNYAGVHPKILKAIQDSNVGHSVAYGNDAHTIKLLEKMKESFGQDMAFTLVLNGTAANVLGLKLLLKPFEAVLCSGSAHIHNDEGGAPEQSLGCKIIPVTKNFEKLNVPELERVLEKYMSGGFHKPQPKVISITQPTEWGQVYTIEELTKIMVFARNHGLYIHMDGARLSNACANLEMDLKAMFEQVSVDVLSFGGTKNGLMYGDALVVFNKDFHDSLPHIVKNGMQMASKMRFLSASFLEYLNDNLYLSLAKVSNGLAQNLAQQLSTIPDVTICLPVQSNAVFVQLPQRIIEPLSQVFPFYIWDNKDIVRFMTSFDTTEDEIDRLVNTIKSLL